MAYSGTSSINREIPIQQKHIDRFWSRVRRGSNDECWEWTGGRSKLGYGRMTVIDRGYYAHRIADTIVNGPPPPGIYICHHCDNRLCVNPRHLYRGTQLDNVRDREARGRGRYRDKTARIERNRRLAEAYESGLSIRAIASLYGIDPTTVWHALRSEGVTMRPSGRTRSAS